jgi:AcrR family transcriptional regulator
VGVKERRERERQELRSSILAAAREVAAQEGWQALTMRKVAELIEYSPPTIYEYFESKDSILVELMRDSTRKLLERLRTAAASTDDPEERMVRLTLAYCDFAWENPELYQLAHGMGGAACDLGQLPTEMAELGEIMMGGVRGALQSGPEDKRDFHDAAAIHRATLHGLVSLTMQGHLSGGRERATQLVERAVRDWIAVSKTAS